MRSPKSRLRLSLASKIKADPSGGRNIEVHVNTLLAKIGAANRTEAVAIALRKQLLNI